MIPQENAVARAWAFWIPAGLWFALAGSVILATDQPDLHLTLNGLNAFGGNTFFRYITYLGDRRVAWLIGAALCFRQVRCGVAVLAAAIGAGLSTEVLKYGVIGPVPRPVALFGEPSPLYLVPEFKNHLDYSMPSGHAAIAFALFASLALQVRRRWAQAVFAVLAVLVAYSRVFLSEHFLEDVYVGSWVGLIWALLAWALLRPDAGNRPVPDALQEAAVSVD